VDQEPTIEMRIHVRLRIAGVAISGPVILLLLACGTAIGQSWFPRAPGPNTHGQVENIADGEVVGAINAVAAHPKDPNILYVGTVNGGIWRTGNGMAAIPKGTAEGPSWEHQTDSQRSLSIGALEFDPTDHTNQTLVAGTGCFSSFGSCGAAPSGLLRTTDGGATWTAGSSLPRSDSSAVYRFPIAQGPFQATCYDDCNGFADFDIYRWRATPMEWVTVQRDLVWARPTLQVSGPERRERTCTT
jgi:hypothetical protein